METAVQYPEINGFIVAIALAPGDTKREAAFLEQLDGEEVPITFDESVPPSSYRMTYELVRGGTRRDIVYDAVTGERRV